jgi:hypothetical protein
MGPWFHPVLHGPLDDLVAVRARLRNDTGLQLRLARLGAQIRLHRLRLDDVPWRLEAAAGDGSWDRVGDRVGTGWDGIIIGMATKNRQIIGKNS